MIHLTTAAGGRVEHVARSNQVARRGQLLARVQPDEGATEEIIAPFDALIAMQRLHGQIARRFTHVVSLRRVVIATCKGRVRWVATLGPVSVGTLVALVEHQDAIRPHRSGGAGFVGVRFVRPGSQVSPGMPMVEIRGEEML